MNDNASEAQYGTPTPVPSIGIPTPGKPVHHESLPMTGFAVVPIAFAAIFALVVGFVMRRKTRPEEAE